MEPGAWQPDSPSIPPTKGEGSAQGCCSTRSRTNTISEQAGIRALLTHPIDADADASYRRSGLESTPVRGRRDNYPDARRSCIQAGMSRWPCSTRQTSTWSGRST